MCRLRIPNGILTTAAGLLFIGTGLIASRLVRPLAATLGQMGHRLSHRVLSVDRHIDGLRNPRIFVEHGAGMGLEQGPAVPWYPTVDGAQYAIDAAVGE
jgi:hypothetical protein